MAQVVPFGVAVEVDSFVFQEEPMEEVVHSSDEEAVLHEEVEPSGVDSFVEVESMAEEADLAEGVPYQLVVHVVFEGVDSTEEVVGAVLADSLEDVAVVVVGLSVEEAELVGRVVVVAGKQVDPSVVDYLAEFVVT